MHRKKRILCFLILAFLSFGALSQSPIGQWYSYDDKCVRRSIVKIYERKDKTLAGTVIKLLNPPLGESKIEPKCTSCRDEKKGKEKIGMDVFWGLKLSADEDPPEWDGGKVLNTDSGREYNCKIWMKSDDVLVFRGYLGIGLFGKNVEWTRVPSDAKHIPVNPETDPTVPKECVSQHKKMLKREL